jgi:hypothetical protein
MTILAEIAEDLVRTALADNPRETMITLLAVSVSHLRAQPALQLELPFGLPDEKRLPGSRQASRVGRPMARWTPSVNGSAGTRSHTRRPHWTRDGRFRTPFEVLQKRTSTTIDIDRPTAAIRHSLEYGAAAFE